MVGLLFPLSLDIYLLLLLVVVVFVAPLADRPVAVAEVVVYIEYISASMGNASHAAVMPKNRSYLTKVMQAAAMAPMYGLARPSQGAVARRMRTKAGY